jgi:hypothetical protein
MLADPLCVGKVIGSEDFGGSAGVFVASGMNEIPAPKRGIAEKLQVELNLGANVISSASSSKS